MRENKLANFLRDHGPMYSTWDKTSKDIRECSEGKPYRPDFTFELPTHVIVLECDEFQHAHPGYACDERRMVDVFNSFGGVHVVFVRWNPDAYKIAGEAQTAELGGRLAALRKVLLREIAHVPTPTTERFRIVRMYYDGPAEVQMTCVSLPNGAFHERPS